MMDEKKSLVTTESSPHVACLESSADWDSPQQLRAVKDELLQMPRPHKMALQECASARWASETFKDDGYVSIGSVASHEGFVSLSVQEKILIEQERIANYQFATRTPASHGTSQAAAVGDG